LQASGADALKFTMLDRSVHISCPQPELSRLLLDNFGAMATSTAVPPDISYQIQRLQDGDFDLTTGTRSLRASEVGDLLFLLEKDITVSLQERRPDLFFLHSAVLEWNGYACLLAAESGVGKSTTAWGLLHHGFTYLSDELAPVDPKSVRVHAYPHALCVKRDPPPGYALPPDTVRLGRTLHVPVRALPAPYHAGTRPVAAVFLLTYRPELPGPQIEPMNAAEAAARLYVNALNALAHPHLGLDAVLSIAQAVPCFRLQTAGLKASCELIQATMRKATANCTAPPSGLDHPTIAAAER